MVKRKKTIWSIIWFIIKLIKFIKERKSLKKSEKNKTLHLYIQEYKVKNYLTCLDKNYVNRKIVKWHLTIVWGLVPLNGSGQWTYPRRPVHIVMEKTCHFLQIK